MGKTERPQQGTRLETTSCTTMDLIADGACRAMRSAMDNTRWLQGMLDQMDELDDGTAANLDECIAMATRAYSEAAMETAQRLIHAKAIRERRTVDMTQMSPGMIRMVMEQAAFAMDEIEQWDRAKAGDDQLIVRIGEGKACAQWSVAEQLARAMHPGTTLGSLQARMRRLARSTADLTQEWRRKKLQGQSEAAERLQCRLEDVELLVPEDRAFMACWHLRQA